MSLFFRVLLPSLILLYLPLQGNTTPPAEGYFQVTALAPDLLLLSTDQGSYCNNSLVFTGEDGILLVDTHHGRDAEAFRDFVDALGFGPPRYVISTHRHQEHIGGNHLWGDAPVGIAHHLFPEKLRSGTFLFNEYPTSTFPDITFTESLEITFNDELIRLVNIGGSHDDNEIMVYFTGHKVAHISSVVNGFNFPSLDSDGDVLRFEATTRRIMTLLPEDTRLISGHHGKTRGFDVAGRWEELSDYADMMHATVEIVREELKAGRTVEQMQEAGVLDAYRDYAGSYVDTDEWIEYIVEDLTKPEESRADICKPLYATWKEDGAQAAVDQYRRLAATQERAYDFSDYVLLGVGSKLYAREMYDDARVFLQACADLYPGARYAYYTQYLLAQSCRALGDVLAARDHCRESVRLAPDFAAAADLMQELEGTPAD